MLLNQFSLNFLKNEKATWTALMVTVIISATFAQQKEFKTFGIGLRYYPGPFNKYIQEQEGAKATLQNHFLQTVQFS